MAHFVVRWECRIGIFGECATSVTFHAFYLFLSSTYLFFVSLPPFSCDALFSCLFFTASRRAIVRSLDGGL